jgi:TonB family protein
MHSVSKFMMTFLLNAVWQAPLVALAGWTCSRLLRSTPGKHAYRVWVSCLVLSLVVPLLSVLRPAEILPSLAPVSIAVSSNSAFSNSSFWQVAYARLFHARISFGSLHLEWVGVLYLIFVVAWLLRFLRLCEKTRRLRRSAYARQLPAAIVPILQRCKHAFALESVPVLCSALARGPITIGICNPVVIIPEFLFVNGSEEQWLSSLAHEFAHIRRRDFLFNLLQELISWPIAFHLAVIMMKRQISAARERACDEMATAHLIQPANYARALVSIAGMMPSLRPRSQPEYSLGIFDADIIEDRIMNLLRNHSPSTPWTKTLMLLTAAIMLLCCASLSAFSFRVDNTNAASIVSFGPAAQAQDALKVGPGVTPPKVISKVNPTYPVDAKKAGHQGIVQLALIIGSDGKVENVRVVKSVDPSLDKSAVDAVRQWTFEPAVKDGKPVKVEVKTEIAFSLKK